MRIGRWSGYALGVLAVGAMAVASVVVGRLLRQIPYDDEPALLGQLVADEIASGQPEDASPRADQPTAG